ncbi:FAD dependent oxidoreductase domain-containing protein [Purpureocillium lavendulum]|uniref:FAD dependent oxidoreductase domain-containing protein n=1 Tax=Purpureocillium lavendulum TaxID=1247861 RepID=A0AB34FJF8_9HYPO|nr:FAD dependent oxidoreductase domain-containing protein [Purpureocillium lavendulum]
MRSTATGQSEGRARLAPPQQAFVPNGAQARPIEQTYNDTYVVAYDFSDVDYDVAAKEFNVLLDSLEAAGLHTEVRPSFEKTILVFTKAPTQLLGNTVYKSRVRDWLYSITQVHPDGDKDTVVRGWYEAEDLLAMYHLVCWPKELGGAGITPEAGRWQNVKATFPLHNERTNQVLLKHLSRRLVLTVDDFDKIRNLFGAKVAFYFAFIQTYLMFLTFPAITGVITWLFLSQYSLAYAILTSIWCSVFLEYWKVQEVDLSIRWNTRGVNKAKTNRPEFKYEQVLVDANGRTRHYFPKWKHITRQLLQIPFIALATALLGAIICCVFAVEILISEAYDGPYQFYLEYLPTVLLAVAIPYMSSSLEGIATLLTQYENHRTADQHEMSLTQKIFVLNIITNYLPILLTAFVYVPFGHVVVPNLKGMLQHLWPSLESRLSADTFLSDPNRLRNEVIALTVTGQISSFFEENFLPLIKHKFRGWHRDYRRAHSKDAMLLRMTTDDPDETAFLKTCRNQGTLPLYNVQDDIAEIVLQFGYLALFAPVWPLISLGFLINNWIELRSDFAKICIEHRRPTPTRADGIGPWVQSLEMLTWLGSITTAAVVHLFGSKSHESHWVTLPITIFISEHILLVLRVLARWVFERFGSEQIRKERDQRYARRLSYLERIEANRQAGLHLSPAERERRKSVLVSGSDSFWTKQVDDGMSAAAGLRLINLAREWDAKHADAIEKKKA